MRILIPGAGAVGELPACIFHGNGHEDSILARGAHLVQLMCTALPVRRLDGQMACRPAIATDDPTTFAGKVWWQRL